MRGEVRRRLAIFAVVSLIAVGYAGTKYARLTDHVVSTSYTVDVQLAESGGIFTGAEVTYRGVPVGRVGDVDVTRDGIVAGLEIDKDRQVPADVMASVHNRSAVGEQYVDLVPVSSGPPYLAEGAEIPRERTTIPLAEEVLIEDTRDLARSVPLDDLRTVIAELGTGFRGSGPELQRILDGSNELVDAAAEHLPETIALLRDSAVVLRTTNQSASSIRGFARDLAGFSGSVRQSDAHLRKTVRQSVGFAREFRLMLAGLEPAFGPLLSNLMVLNEIGATHLPHIEQALVALPWSLKGTINGARHGRGQFVIASSSDPVSCKAGYLPPSMWRSTLDGSTVPPDYSVRCKDGSPVLPRGSHHAVPPTE